MIGDYEDGMRSLKGAEELRKRTKKKKKLEKLKLQSSLENMWSQPT